MWDNINQKKPPLVICSNFVVVIIISLLISSLLFRSECIKIVFGGSNISFWCKYLINYDLQIFGTNSTPLLRSLRFKCSIQVWRKTKKLKINIWRESCRKTDYLSFVPILQLDSFVISFVITHFTIYRLFLSPLSNQQQKNSFATIARLRCRSE